MPASLLLLLLTHACHACRGPSLRPPPSLCPQELFGLCHGSTQDSLTACVSAMVQLQRCVCGWEAGCLGHSQVSWVLIVVTCIIFA